MCVELSGPMFNLLEIYPLPNEPVEVAEPLICFPLLEILKASNVAFELSIKNPNLLRLVFS